MTHRSILENSNVGLEIETCVYVGNYAGYTFEIPGYEIRDIFFQHLKLCLTSKGLDIIGPYDVDPGYNKWRLVEDGSIRCPNNLPEIRELNAEEKTIFAKKYKYARGPDDMLNYAATEIVTSVYNYLSISKMIDDISSCLITDNFAYGFNSSQGIHYNISNTLLNQNYDERVRNQEIERILELFWYLEPMFVRFLPRYRQEEVYDGMYCNSLERVFGTLDNMKSNWRNFYIKNDHEHKQIDSGNGFFVPKYTIVNLKNITAHSTKDVYFEFRMGSIHMYPALLEAWIKMLSVLVASGIDEEVYSYLMSQVKPLSEQIHISKEKLFRCKNPEEIGGINNEIKVAVLRQEEAFAEILAAFDKPGEPSMVENTLGVIEGLELLGGPGTG